MKAGEAVEYGVELPAINIPFLVSMMETNGFTPCICLSVCTTEEEGKKTSFLLYPDFVC